MTAMGSSDDGGPYDGLGHRAEPWPLLTGERGHYELAAGRDAGSLHPRDGALRDAIGICFPSRCGTQPDRPRPACNSAGPTGAAMPLMWAHAEYIKLLRSARDGQVFDRVPSVVERYQGSRAHVPIEVWTFQRRVRSVRAARSCVSTRGRRFGCTGRPPSGPPSATPIRRQLRSGSTSWIFRSCQAKRLRSGSRFSGETRRWEGRDFEINVVT